MQPDILSIFRNAENDQLTEKEIDWLKAEILHSPYFSLGHMILARQQSKSGGSGNDSLKHASAYSANRQLLRIFVETVTVKPPEIVIPLTPVVVVIPVEEKMETPPPPMVSVVTEVVKPEEKLPSLEINFYLDTLVSLRSEKFARMVPVIRREIDSNRSKLDAIVRQHEVDSPRIPLVTKPEIPKVAVPKTPVAKTETPKAEIQKPPAVMKPKRGRPPKPVVNPAETVSLKKETEEEYVPTELEFIDESAPVRKTSKKSGSRKEKEKPRSNQKGKRKKKDKDARKGKEKSPEKKSGRKKKTKTADEKTGIHAGYQIGDYSSILFVTPEQLQQEKKKKKEKKNSKSKDNKRKKETTVRKPGKETGRKKKRQKSPISEIILEGNDRIVEVQVTRAELRKYFEGRNVQAKEGSGKTLKKKTETQVIDKFIAAEPTLTDPRLFQLSGKEHGNESILKDETVVTETLAIIHAKQGNRRKATEMYRKLQLIFPEKSVYFAIQIENLRKK